MPKRTKLVIGAAVAAVILLPTAAGSFYQIQEQEQAVLVTFGKPKAVTETGLHLKRPLSQQVHKVNTTIQGFPFGYNEADNEVVESESIMITSDYNFIDVDFFVEYRISDPVAYLYASREPEQILRSISQSCIRNVIGSYVVDDVLTTGKSAIQAKIKEMIGSEGELFAMGFTDFRVRWYAGAARLQFPTVQLPRVLERREEILTKLKKYYPAVLLALEVRG